MPRRRVAAVRTRNGIDFQAVACRAMAAKTAR